MTAPTCAVCGELPEPDTTPPAKVVGRHANVTVNPTILGPYCAACAERLHDAGMRHAIGVYDALAKLLADVPPALRKPCAVCGSEQTQAVREHAHTTVHTRAHTIYVRISIFPQQCHACGACVRDELNDERLHATRYVLAATAGKE